MIAHKIAHPPSFFAGRQTRIFYLGLSMTLCLLALAACLSLWAQSVEAQSQRPPGPAQPSSAATAPEADAGGSFTPNEAGVLVEANKMLLADIVITMDTTWPTATITAHNLIITNNARLTLQGVTTLTVTNLTIHAGAALAADGTGYGSNQGLGRATLNVYGASHGGYGDGRTVAPYGNPYQPVNMGSGGRNGGAAGGRGGGAIHLIVSDTLLVNGRLSANATIGANCGGVCGGGGGASGGSLWIETHIISGTGTIEANGSRGGAGWGTDDGGGGAGGRIALYAADDFFSARADALRAWGGSDYGYGGPGTIYLDTDISPHELRVDNNDRNGPEAFLPPGAPYTFTTLRLEDSGHVRVGDSNAVLTSVLTLTNNTLAGDGSGKLYIEGTLAVPAQFVASQAQIHILGRLVPAAAITVTQNGQLTFYADNHWNNNTFTFDSLYIGNTASINFVAGVSNNSVYTDDFGVNVIVNDLTIAPGGALAADGTGYGSNQGPGRASHNTFGASHGGYGDGRTVPPYGNPYQPVDLGSGGRNDSTAGGRGGGAIYLTVADTLLVNGRLSANATNGVGCSGYGCGGGGGAAGGSLWIDTHIISGTGTIEANGSSGGGGYGTDHGGGGAGGRIALYAANDLFSARADALQARGGVNYGFGGPGTVYLHTNISPHELRVDNNDRNGPEAFLPAGEPYAFDTLSLTNFGHLQVAGDMTLAATLGNGSGRLIVQDVLTATHVLTFHHFHVVAQGPMHVVDPFQIDGVVVDITGELVGAADITIADNGQLLLATQSYPSGTLAIGNLTLSDGRLTLASYDNGDADFTNDTGFTLIAPNVTLTGTGLIEANGQGYGLNNGPAAHINGASHGGIGGGGLPPYGQVYQPVDLGSSGNNNRGGGAIHLIVTNTLLLHGAIEANGVQDGSGGSIWIEASSFSGSGAITANGGGSAGGGGRVAVYAPDHSNFSGSYTAAFGGGNCPVSNCNGTVHLNSADPLLSTLSVSPTMQIADGNSPSTVAALLKTAANVPLPNEGLELAVTPANNVFINGQLAADDIYVGDSDANGLVTAVITATAPGNYVISARTTTGVPLNAQPVMTFTVGPVDGAISTLSVDKQSVRADALDAATIFITLLDQFGHPVPGKAVQTQATGNITLTQPVAVTDNNGRVTATIRSADVQTVTVSAIVQTDNITLTQTAVVQFTPAPATLANSTIVVTPTVAVANNSDSLMISATLRDRLNRPLANRPVELIVTGGGNTILPAPQTNTDAAGQLTFYLASSLTGSKNLSLRDVAGQSTLSFSTVTFLPGAVDTTQSRISTVGFNPVAANGQQYVAVEITAVDTFGNPIVGAIVSLAANGPVTITQPVPTNSSGRTIGTLRSQQVGTFAVAASINGVPLNATVSAIFAGADLVVTKSGPGTATAGYPVLYQITVANQGFLPATNIILTDTLPSHITFITQTSPYPYNAAGSTITWQVGALAAGESATFTLETLLSAAAPIGGSRTNRVVGSLAEPEIDDTNNEATSVLLVQQPLPKLVVSPAYPTLHLPAGLTMTQVITVRNAGTAVLQAATVQPPAFTPWVTIDQTTLGDLLPGEFVTFTLTAATQTVSQNGQYRDRLRIATNNAGFQDVFLTLKVHGLARDLHLTLTDDQNQPISHAYVKLAEPIYVVTEGVADTATYYRQGYTNVNGELTFRGLETGKDYSFTIQADRYDARSGTVTLVEGVGAQAWSVLLNGRPGLGLLPHSLTFNMYRGNLAQKTLTIRNSGTAPLTDLNLTASGIEFLFLGQPAAGTIIPPGGKIDVTVNAAPLLTETAGVNVYQGNIQVTASGGQNATIPVTVNLQDEIVRTLCLRLQTDLGGPLTQATVRLTDLSGKVVASGNTTETIQPVYTQSTDKHGPGYSCFPDLSPGPYQVRVGRDEILFGEEVIDVVPGTGIQEEIIVVDEPSVVATWRVTPTTIGDDYTTVFTLTFVPHATPRLALSPDRINFCGDEDGVITQTITVHNFYPVTMTNAIMNIQDSGNVSAVITGPNGSGADGSFHIGTIPPNSHLPLELRASLNTPTCAGNQGTISLNVEADYQHYVPESWYWVDATPASVAPGQQAIIPLKLANTGFPADSNLNGIPPALENIVLIPPQDLTWITVSTTTISSLAVGQEIGFDLIVQPPLWLSPGFYYDAIQVNATNGITTLIGIEAEMTSEGLRIETQFVTPLAPGAGGTPPPNPPPSTPDNTPPWDDIVTNWNPDIFGPQETILASWLIKAGCYCTSPVSSWSVVGNSLVRFKPPSAAPGPGVAFSPDFKDNTVVLQLEQRFSLDREAFTADLTLANGLPVPLTEVEVDIFFINAQGESVLTRLPGQIITVTGTFTPLLPSESIVPTTTLLASLPGRWQKIYPVNFIVVPETPSSLPHIGGGSSHFASWTLIPDAPGLTEVAYFDVHAVIRYKVNGVQKELVTEPQSITVQPQPRIMIDYYLPNYVLGGQTFEWLVVATNVGYGHARNFRLDTPQPKIVAQGERYPTDFTIIGPPTLSWGDLPPGEQVGGAWRILPSQPGTFVDWEAVCKHQNYKGVTLPPLIYCEPNVHFYDTSFLAESQQWNDLDSCFAGFFQNFAADPINTFSGNFTYSETDVHMPAWGQPLTFVRSYNARDTKDGPFGPGWTHNFNMDLAYESFIGMDENGLIGQQTYFAARLPHGSVAYFHVSPDGNTLTPYPGVRAELTRNLDVYTLTQKCEQLTYTYNAAQNLTAVADRNGNQITLTYDGNDNLTAVTDPAGRQLTFAYDAQNHITRMTDPLGRSTVYTYTQGYLTAMADFRGKVTHYTYSLPGQLPGQLVSLTDPNGHVKFTNQYDAERRVIAQDDALGNRTTFAYALNGVTDTSITTMTDPRGHVTIDTYDSHGRLIRQEDALGNAEAYAYDEFHNMIRLTDKNGRVTLYGWNDCHCDLAQIVDPMGHTITRTFAAHNQVLTETDERGFTTGYTYDAHGNLTSITDPAGHTRSFTYGVHGELLTETDEKGHTTSYAYDAYGHTTVITNALGQAVTMEHDIVGRLLGATDALGRSTAYTYDAGDNMLTAVDAVGHTTTFVYDDAGNLVQTTDALGRVTTSVYSPRHEVIRTTDPLGGQQTFTYDANGNQLTHTNANGHTTTYQYDPLKRRIRVTDSLSGTRQYSYDPTGNRLTQTNPNGHTTQYSYDDSDRLVTTTFADGSQMTAVYDAADNVVARTDAEGRTLTYQYDARGRLTTLTNPISGTTTYAYDAAGNQTGLTDAEGRTTTFAYDALNRVTTITDPLNGVTTYTYDAIGNQTSQTDANGRTTHTTYDALNRAIQVTNAISGTVHYAYDAVGNQIHVTDPLGRVTSAAYDDLNRLIRLTNVVSDTVAYAYDAVGNLQQLTDEEGRTTHYQYDALNRLTTVTDPLNGASTYQYDANGNPIVYTDAAGRTTTFVYDNLEQLITVTDPLNGTTTYAYDLVGNHIQTTDARGQITQFTYDGLDRLTERRDPALAVRRYVYDGVGNVRQFIDEEGHTTFYTYDAGNRPLTVTDALGHSQSYHYDVTGNLLTITDALGRQTTFAYDPLARLTAVTDPLGQTLHMTYDLAGNQLSQTDEKGRTTTYAYDALNQLVVVTNPLSGTTHYTYSPAGNLLSQQNPLGQTITYQYDALDRLTHVVDALGQVMTYTYDAVGNPLQVTDVQNRTVYFQYDPLNRLTQTLDPLGGLTHYTYDALGNQLSQTNANGHTTLFTYDALNRLATVTDPLSQITTFTYDKAGNQLTLTDPLSRTTTFHYDAVYRLTNVVDPLGHTTTYAYDAAGNQTALTDAAGHTAVFAYDALNRPVQVTNPLSGTTTTVYDEVGNPVQTTDPEGRVTTYAYDDLDRLQTITDPLNQVTAYAYDALGNLRHTTDARGHTAVYTYDALNRLIQVTDSLSGTTTFAYDTSGNLVRQVDPLGHEVGYTLDALNRVVTVTNALNHAVTLTYDALGNVTQTRDAHGRITQMSYDPLNRLTAVTNPLGQVTHYEYDAVGNHTAVTDPLGNRLVFTYDPLDRLQSLTNPLNQATTYAYDAVGNTTAIIDAHNITTHYTYDALSRLTQVTENYVEGGPANATTNVATAFNYDRVGNLAHITDPRGQTRTLEYDALNRLTRDIDPLNLPTTYAYDAVGNMVLMVDANSQTTAYNYDPLNRLTTITRPDEIVNFTYDAAGNRLSMNDGRGTTTYQYDALNRPLAITDPLSQTVQYGYDAVGNRTSLIYPGGEQVNYTYDAANRLLAVADWDSGSTHYTYDAAGRLTQVLLPNGITGTFGYDGNHQLTLLRYENISGTIASYVYSYDQVGNRTQVVEAAVPLEIVPTAVFTATPQVGAAPLTVTFANLSQNAHTYVWDFGDGQLLTTTAAAPLTHVYTQTGLFTVTLTAHNDNFSHTMARTSYILVATPDAFQESGGQVTIEAENVLQIIERNGQNWAAQTGFPGFEGGSYLQLLPDRGALYATNYITRSPELRYQITFVTPGDYVVWAHGAAVNGGGDSIHVGLNGAGVGSSKALTGFPLQQWGWSSQTAVGISATLSIPTPGLYTLHVWAREDGVRLDRLLLTQDTSYRPTGGGPPESPRTGDGQAALLILPFSEVNTWFVVNNTAGSNVAAGHNRIDPAVAAAMIMSNTGMFLMAPLAMLAPIAYRRRRKYQRWLQALAALFMMLTLLGLGYALARGSGFSYSSPIALSTVPEEEKRGARFNPFLSPMAHSGQNQALSALAQQSGQSLTINYTYDPLYRLTGAQYSDGHSYGYTYDAASNRLSTAVNGAQTAAYTYDMANRLIQVNSQVYTYDNNGNLLNDGDYTYTYDSANRLAQRGDGVSTYEYLYNGDGMRVAQIVDGLRTDYVQDTAVALPQVLTARTAGTVTNYLRGLGLIGEQRAGIGPAAPSPVWQYHLPDALGSVRHLAGAQGQVTLNQTFDPFGSRLAVTGEAASAYGFAGEEQEVATGQIFLRARTYDPAHGRFLQPDTIFGDPQQPRTLHRYSYAFNSPVTYTDPSGQMPRTSGGRPPHHGGTPQPSTRGSDPFGGGGGSPSRSVNNSHDQPTASEAQAKRQSRGQRPFLCSVSDLFGEMADLGRDMASAVENLSAYLQDGDITHLNDALEDMKAAVEHYKAITENPIVQLVVQVIVMFSPLDEIVDLISLITGRDLITGEELTDFDRALIIIGLLTGGIGDDLLEGGGKAARSADDAGRVGRNLEDAEGLGRPGRAGHNVSHVAPRATNISHVSGASVVADDLGEAVSASHHLDDFDDAHSLRRGIDGDDVADDLADSANGPDGPIRGVGTTAPAVHADNGITSPSPAAHSIENAGQETRHHVNRSAQPQIVPLDENTIEYRWQLGDQGDLVITGRRVNGKVEFETNNLDAAFATPDGKPIALYSGENAYKAAQAQGFAVLENTALGQAANHFHGHYAFLDNRVWESASESLAHYASKNQGTIHVFLNQMDPGLITVPASRKIFLTHELDILLDNMDLSNIKLEIIKWEDYR